MCISEIRKLPSGLYFVQYALIQISDCADDYINGFRIVSVLNHHHCVILNISESQIIHFGFLGKIDETP